MPAYLLFLCISDKDSFGEGDRVVVSMTSDAPIPVPDIGDLVEVEGYTLKVHHRTFAYGVAVPLGSVTYGQGQGFEMQIGSVTLLCTEHLPRDPFYLPGGPRDRSLGFPNPGDRKNAPPTAE